MRSLFVVTLTSILFSPNAFSDPISQNALDALITLQESTGGWGDKYTQDGTIMWGEHKPLPKDWITIQPAATPTVGDLMLRAARVLDDSSYFESATRAKEAMLALQTELGGFPHEGPPAKGSAKRGTFDDDTTTASLRFFLNYWKYTGKKEDLEDVLRVGDFIIAAQHATGAWTQYYPPPESGYQRYITFNDNVFSNCISALLLLYKETGEVRFRDAARRGGEAVLKLQGGEGEAIWGQQYDPDTLEPAWARKFEPPGYAAAESRAVCDTLIDLYLEFEDERYLESLDRAFHWYDTHKLPNGKWARLYEPGTQTPVYGRRDKAVKVYDVEKATSGYSWQGNWYPTPAQQNLATIREKGVDALRAQRAAKNTPNADSLKNRAQEIAGNQHASGLWFRKATDKELEQYKHYEVDPSVPMFSIGQIVYNTGALLDAIEAETHAGE